MNHLHAYPFLCKIMNRKKPGAAYRLSGNGFIISPYYVVTTGNAIICETQSSLSPLEGVRVVMNKTEQLLEIVDYFKPDHDQAASDVWILKLKQPLWHSPAPLVSQITAEHIKQLKIKPEIYLLGYNHSGAFDVIKKKIKRWVFDENGQLQSLAFNSDDTRLLPGAPIMANCYDANKLIKVAIGVMSSDNLRHSTCDRIIDVVQTNQLPIPVGFQADNLKWPQHTGMIGYLKNIVNLIKLSEIDDSKLSKA